ncbi:MAG: alpha/beta fold hydrolase [Nodosilinea sp.]
MATATIFGVPHYYQFTPARGAAPLVFIHGWLLSQRYWQPIVSQLSSSHPCLTYDLRGFGESRYDLNQFVPGFAPGALAAQASLSPYGLAAYARDLAALIQHLDLPPVWLVGHSLGGSIALWLAHCYPKRVKGIICLNAGGGIYIERDFRRFRQVGEQIVRRRQAWLRHVPLLPLALTRSMVSQPLAYEWGRQRLQDLLVAHPDAALGTLLESTTPAEVHLLPRLVQSLEQPIYFVAGRQDPVMDLKFVNHLAGYLPTAGDGQCPVIALDNCGHMAMVEQPQRVVAILKSLVS